MNNVLKNEDVLNAYIRGRGGMADALGWGPSGRNPVEVQVLSAASKNLLKKYLHLKNKYDKIIESPKYNDEKTSWISARSSIG